MMNIKILFNILLRLFNFLSNISHFIGKDGKNIHLVGNLGTALIVCLMGGLLMMNIIYVSGFEIGTFAGKNVGKCAWSLMARSILRPVVDR